MYKRRQGRSGPRDEALRQRRAFVGHVRVAVNDRQLSGKAGRPELLGCGQSSGAGANDQVARHFSPLTDFDSRYEFTPALSRRSAERLMDKTLRTTPSF